MELSGRVVKQGYLAKQVCLPWSGEEAERQDCPQRTGRAELAREHEQSAGSANAGGPWQVQGERQTLLAHKAQARGWPGKRDT